MSTVTGEQIVENVLRVASTIDALVWLSVTNFSAQRLAPSEVGELANIVDVSLSAAAPPGSPLGWYLWGTPIVAHWRDDMPYVKDNWWPKFLLQAASFSDETSLELSEQVLLLIP